MKTKPLRLRFKHRFVVTLESPIDASQQREHLIRARQVVKVERIDARENAVFPDLHIADSDRNVPSWIARGVHVNAFEVI